MYNSQYYTCEQIDERLLQGYLDDYNSQTGQSLTKVQFLTALYNAISVASEVVPTELENLGKDINLFTNIIATEVSDDSLITPSAYKKGKIYKVDLGDQGLNFSGFVRGYKYYIAKVDGAAGDSLDDTSKFETTYSSAEALNKVIGYIKTDNDNIHTQVGYYECDTAGATAAKTIAVANYSLFVGGSLKVKFANKNTADNATLNINSQGTKALYYQGERASATNSWDAEEVVEIYYDGTSYYANNVKGGSGSGVYDVSKEHPTSGPNGDGKFTLEYILNSSNVNELIPVNKRYPGMSIQFVSTSDNIYVQYRLMADEWSTATVNWVKDDITVYLDSFLDGTIGKDVFSHNGYYSTSGVWSNGTAYTTGYVRVYSGDVIKLLYSCYNMMGLAAFDKDFNLVLEHCITTNIAVVLDISYTVPEGICYLRFTNRDASSPKAEVVVNRVGVSETAYSAKEKAENIERTVYEQSVSDVFEFSGADVKKSYDFIIPSGRKFNVKITSTDNSWNRLILYYNNDSTNNRLFDKQAFNGSIDEDYTVNVPITKLTLWVVSINNTGSCNMIVSYGTNVLEKTNENTADIVLLDGRIDRLDDTIQSQGTLISGNTESIKELYNKTYGYKHTNPIWTSTYKFYVLQDGVITLKTNAGTRYTSEKIAVEPGTVFTVKLHEATYSSIPTLISLDVNGNVAEGKYADSTEYYEGKYTVPKGVSYVILQTDYTGSTFDVEFINTLEGIAYKNTHDVGIINNSAGDLDTSWKSSDSIYYKSGGVIVSDYSATRYMSEQIPVKQGWKFLLCLVETNNNVPTVVALDKYGNIVQASCLIGAQDGSYIVPEGVDYLVFQCNSNTYSSFRSEGLNIVDNKVYPTKLKGFGGFAGDNWEISSDKTTALSSTVGSKLIYATNTFGDKFNISAAFTPSGTSFEVGIGKFYTGLSATGYVGTIVALLLDSGHSYVTLNSFDNSNNLVRIKTYELPGISLVGGNTYNVTVQKRTGIVSYFNVFVSDSEGNTDRLYELGLPSSNYSGTTDDESAGSVVGFGWGKPCVILISGTSVSVDDFTYGYPVGDELDAMFIGHSFIEGNSIAEADGGKQKRFANIVAHEIGDDKTIIIGQGGQSIASGMDSILLCAKMFSNAKYAIICEGANDGVLTTNTSNRQNNILIFKLNVEKIEAEYVKYGVKTVWLSVPPYADSPSEVETDLNSLNTWLSENVQNYVDINPCFYTNGEIDASKYLSDNIHPTVATHSAIANVIKASASYLMENTDKPINVVGTSSSRPNGIMIDVGFQYYDTTLNKVIYASAIGTSPDYVVTWVDAVGNQI